MNAGFQAISNVTRTGFSISGSKLKNLFDLKIALHKMHFFNSLKNSDDQRSNSHFDEIQNLKKLVFREFKDPFPVLKPEKPKIDPELQFPSLSFDLPPPIIDWSEPEESKISASFKNQFVKGSISTHRFFFEKKTQNDIKGSFWEKEVYNYIEEIQDLPIDFSEFNKQMVQEEKKQPSVVLTNVKFDYILDPVRIGNLGIFLSQIKLPAQEISKALHSVDMKIIDIDLAESIVRLKLSESEERLFHQRDKNLNLCRTEIRMIEIYDIIGLMNACQLILLRREIDEELKRITNSITDNLDAVYGLFHSTKMKEFFAMILRVVMLVQNDKTIAGFTPTGLSKFSQTKAGRTIFNITCNILSKNKIDFCDFAPVLLDKIRKTNKIGDISATVQTLHEKKEKIFSVKKDFENDILIDERLKPFIASFEDFFSDMKYQILEITRRIQHFQDLFKTTQCLYLCEERQEVSVFYSHFEIILSSINNFRLETQKMNKKNGVKNTLRNSGEELEVNRSISENSKQVIQRIKRKIEEIKKRNKFDS